ncbi:unnamed protein product [Arctogadus glacialis]
MAPNEASNDGKEVGEGHSTGLRSSGCQGTHTDDAGRSARGAKEFESSNSGSSPPRCAGTGGEERPLLPPATTMDQLEGPGMGFGTTPAVEAPGQGIKAEAIRGMAQ